MAAPTSRQHKKAKKAHPDVRELRGAKRQADIRNPVDRGPVFQFTKASIADAEEILLGLGNIRL